MERIRYQVELIDSRKTRVDAISGKTVFVYKDRIRDLRELQSALLMLARIMADLSDHSGILILDETKISKRRLTDEWENLQKIFQPSILSRLGIIVFYSGSLIEEFGNIRREESEALSVIQEKLSEKLNKNHHRKPDAIFEILRVLLIHWFRGSEPLQVNKLGQLSGYSYPPVAASLKQLEYWLLRHSDRSVELKSFPRDHWFKLLAAADNIRATRGYHARRPRSVEDLIKRLKEEPEKDVAFGGIIGARHYLPGIDLVGIHRLDLSVHDWSPQKIDKIVQRLDPGLKKAEPGIIPQVVVHSIYRPESLFTNSDNLPIADEVECLLDLHEARLESQALELLEHFKGQTQQ